MRDKRVDSLETLIENAKQNGVKLIACTMSMDVMGITKEELMDGVEYAGVGTYLGDAEGQCQPVHLAAVFAKSLQTIKPPREVLLFVLRCLTHSCSRYSIWPLMNENRLPPRLRFLSKAKKKALTGLVFAFS